MTELELTQKLKEIGFELGVEKATDEVDYAIITFYITSGKNIQKRMIIKIDNNDND